MRYEMKHAKKPDKKSKVKLSRKKIIAITLGSMAGIAVIVLCVLYFQVIFSFINSKIDALSNWFSGGSAIENSEISDGRTIGGVRRRARRRGGRGRKNSADH
jgi:hypothetical protein